MRHCCCSEHCCWDMLQWSCCRLDYPHHRHHPYSPYQCGALLANRDTERHSQSDRHKEKDKERTEQTKQATYLIFLSSSVRCDLSSKNGEMSFQVCRKSEQREKKKWQLLDLAKVNCWQQKVNNNRNGSISIIALTTVKAVSNPHQIASTRVLSQVSVFNDVIRGTTGLLFGEYLSSSSVVDSWVEAWGPACQPARLQSGHRVSAVLEHYHHHHHRCVHYSPRTMTEAEAEEEWLRENKSSTRLSAQYNRTPPKLEHCSSKVEHSTRTRAQQKGSQNREHHSGGLLTDAMNSSSTVRTDSKRGEQRPKDNGPAEDNGHPLMPSSEWVGVGQWDNCNTLAHYWWGRQWTSAAN